MGSFPTILEFDSLGWYLSSRILYSVIYSKLFYLLNMVYSNNFLYKNIYFRKNLLLPKHNKSLSHNNIKLFKFFLHNYLLPKSVLSIVIPLFHNIFSSYNNCLFINCDDNLNYLPVSNKILFSRGGKQLYKTIKFFNINTLVFLNVGKKLSVFNKLTSYKLINVSSSSIINNSKIDFNLGLPNTTFYNYLVYIVVVNLYLKIKN